MNDTYLKHHGIKGMKWGIRRYQNKDGTLTDLGKRRLASFEKGANVVKKTATNGAHMVKKAAGATKKYVFSNRTVRAKITKHQRSKDLKRVRGLSDEELRRRIERVQLEQKYKSMIKQDLTPGRQAVNEILSSSGKKVLTAAAAGTMAYTIKSAMTKKFDWDEAASYVGANPNKKK